MGSSAPEPDDVDDEDDDDEIIEGLAEPAPVPRAKLLVLAVVRDACADSGVFLLRLTTPHLRFCFVVAG